MTTAQILVITILLSTVGLFLWGRFRHDVVALAALLACVVAGIVPADGAFAGFGHPAVITVACVLVLSQGLQNTGAADWLARSVLPRSAGRLTSLIALIGPRRGPFGVHEQRRRDGAADAGCSATFGAAGHDTGAGADAAGLRHDPWRDDHDHRHAAQPDRLGVPGRGGTGTVRHVRLCARGPCRCGP
jgi:hypothetical protein